VYDDVAAVMTVSTVAAVLRVHPDTVRKEIASGRLKALRLGRAVRIARHEFIRWLNERSETGSGVID
jgi:excisionase family DNA binding protein